MLFELHLVANDTTCSTWARPLQVVYFALKFGGTGEPAPAPGPQKPAVPAGGSAKEL